MKIKKSLSARTFRLLLLVILLLVIAGAVASFYFTHGILKEYALTTNKLNQEATASEQNLQNLQTIRSYLDSHEEEVERAKNVVAESKLYGYQDTLVRAISSIARKNGVRVESFSFSDGSSGTTSPQSTPQTTAPTDGSTAAPTAANDVKLVNITLRSPIRYENLLRFIYQIEQNVTRMQITGISLAAEEEGSRNVTTDVFTVQVYVK